jgi:hypothetical protein
MKKNIVGHMMMPKESKMTKFKKLDLAPRLLCLLLALIIWLLVVNVQDLKKDNESLNKNPVEELFE